MKPKPLASLNHLTVPVCRSDITTFSTSQMIPHRPESRSGDSDTPCNVHWIPGAKPDAALRPAWGALPASRSYAPPGIMFIEAVLRSEERRVGKEGRLRWWAKQDKKESQ